MNEIVYDVAVSIDGYIAGEDGDISLFSQDGEHVDAYQQRLGTYKVAIMGRHTYEFGYRYGLTPGTRAYPHMEHFLFSRSLQLPEDAAVSIVRNDWLRRLQELKQEAEGTIYLTGGGLFASFCLEHNLIDRIIIKRNPIVLGSGTPLFTTITNGHQLTSVSVHRYDKTGVVLEEYTCQPAS